MKDEKECTWCTREWVYKVGQHYYPACNACSTAFMQAAVDTERLLKTNLSDNLLKENGLEKAAADKEAKRLTSKS